MRTLEQSEFYVADAPAMLAGDPTVAVNIAAILARRLDAANRSLIEVKRQLQAGEPRSVIGRTVEKVEELLSCSGDASLVYAGYPSDPFVPINRCIEAFLGRADGGEHSERADNANIDPNDAVRAKSCRSLRSPLPIGAASSVLACRWTSRPQRIARRVTVLTSMGLRGASPATIQQDACRRHTRGRRHGLLADDSGEYLDA